MKKILTLCMVFSLCSTAAFAAGGSFTSSGPASGITGITGSALNEFKASANVQVRCNAVAASYGAASDHLNGNRVYGTKSGDALIYYQDKTTTGVQSTVTVASDTSSIGSGWKSL